MNRAKGLWSLISRWDNQPTVEDYGITPTVSNTGNINVAGADAVAESYLLSKNDPDFYKFVENGVRDVVRTIIERFDCVTYSSCEGHQFSTHYEPSNIGVIPRTYEEYISLKRAFVQLVAQTNVALAKENATSDVYLMFEVDKVETDDGPPLTTLEIYFLSISDDADAYFKNLPQASACFLNQLLEIKD